MGTTNGAAPPAPPPGADEVDNVEVPLEIDGVSALCAVALIVAEASLFFGFFLTNAIALSYESPSRQGYLSEKVAQVLLFLYLYCAPIVIDGPNHAPLHKRITTRISLSSLAAPTRRTNEWIFVDHATS
jgi:hypothetical protein